MVSSVLELAHYTPQHLGILNKFQQVTPDFYLDGVFFSFPSDLLGVKSRTQDRDQERHYS